MLMDKLFLLPPIFLLLIFLKKQWWKIKYFNKKPSENRTKERLLQYYEYLLKYKKIKARDYLRRKVFFLIIVLMVLVMIKITNNNILWSRINSFTPAISNTKFEDIKNPHGEELEYTEEEKKLFNNMIKQKYKNEEEMIADIRFQINLGLKTSINKEELISKTLKRLELYKETKISLKDLSYLIGFLILMFLLPDSYLEMCNKKLKRKMKSEIFFSREKYMLLAASMNLEFIDILRIMRADSILLKQIFDEAISVYFDNRILNTEGFTNIVEKYGKNQVDLKIFLQELLIIGSNSKEASIEAFKKLEKIESIQQERVVKKDVELLSIKGQIGALLIIFLIILYAVSPMLEFIDSFSM